VQSVYEEVVAKIAILGLVIEILSDHIFSIIDLCKNTHINIAYIMNCWYRKTEQCNRWKSRKQ